MGLHLESCRMVVEGPVATVTIIPPRNLTGGTADLHWELGEVFSHLRGDTAVRVIVLTGEGGKEHISVMLPPAVAEAVGRCLMSPPAADPSISDMLAAGFELEKRSPAEVIALDEAGQFDDEALDDGLWMALLGAGVSTETLSTSSLRITRTGVAGSAVRSRWSGTRPTRWSWSSTT